MTDAEKELKRIMDSYIELSSKNMQNAIHYFELRCKEVLEKYKNQINNNQ